MSTCLSCTGRIPSAHLGLVHEVDVPKTLRKAEFWSEPQRHTAVAFGFSAAFSIWTNNDHLHALLICEPTVFTRRPQVAVFTL